VAKLVLACIIFILMVSYSVIYGETDKNKEPIVRFDAHKDINVYIEDAPLQVELAEHKIIDADYKGYEITAFAEFSLKARVLSTKNYFSQIMPVDFVLGWQEMSKDEVVKRVVTYQSKRKAIKKYPRDIIGERLQEIKTQSANMHMVPLNEEINEKLLAVRKFDVVQIEGYLVNIASTNGLKWKSSKTRSDTGDGACEIVLVTSINIVEPK